MRDPECPFCEPAPERVFHEGEMLMKRQRYDATQLPKPKLPPFQAV